MFPAYSPWSYQLKCKRKPRNAKLSGMEVGPALLMIQQTLNKAKCEKAKRNSRCNKVTTLSICCKAEHVYFSGYPAFRNIHKESKN